MTSQLSSNSLVYFQYFTIKQPLEVLKITAEMAAESEMFRYILQNNLGNSHEIESDWDERILIQSSLMSRKALHCVLELLKMENVWIVIGEEDWEIVIGEYRLEL